MFQEAAKTRFSITRLIPIYWMEGILAVLFIGLSNRSPGQILPYPYTKTDTIRAVQRLFDYKRTGGRITTKVGGSLALIGAGAGLFAGGAVALINLGKTKNEILPITLAGSVPGFIPTGFGITRLIRYNRRREDRLLDAYESGAPLPGFARRKLRSRYFSAYY
jgi:hypothetical protein